MQKERSNVLRRHCNEYAAALRRETILSKSHDEQQQVVAEQSSKRSTTHPEARWIERQLYESMLQRVKQAGLASAMRASMCWSLIPPNLALPYRPSYPMTPIGLFGGVFLGLDRAARERVDRRISARASTGLLDLPGETGCYTFGRGPPFKQISTFSALRPTAAIPLECPESRLADCPELATWKRQAIFGAECPVPTLTSILLP